MQTVIDYPFVFRPNLTPEETSVKTKKKHERRFVPFDLVPQTIRGIVLKPGVFEFIFEYLINEPSEAESYSRPVMLEWGVNSGKLTKMVIPFKGAADIYHALEITKMFVEDRKVNTSKQSLIHYFNLLIFVLNKMEADLRASNFNPHES